MKQPTKKWAIRTTSTIVLLSAILIGIVLNPSFLYANKTETENFVIYHNEGIDAEVQKRLTAAHELLKKSELFKPEVKLRVCLNDNAPYPKLMKKLKSPAFGWGYYDIIVLQGTANFKQNTVELNNYKWNLEQLIAHEAIHCYQFFKLGLWNSKPFKNHANWKWEGYPEYVSRQSEDQTDLRQNIERLLQHNEETPKNWAINFADGTITSVGYYADWLLVKYCLDVQQLSYEELLNDKRERAVVEEEMWSWYHGNEE